jgi:hypothetical protein
LVVLAAISRLFPDDREGGKQVYHGWVAFACNRLFALVMSFVPITLNPLLSTSVFQAQQLPFSAQCL